MRSTLRYLRHSAPHVKGINPVGHATIRGYSIAAAIAPIVPVPVIGTEPNWLGTNTAPAPLLRYSTGHVAAGFVPSLISRSATLIPGVQPRTPRGVPEDAERRGRIPSPG